MFFFFKQKTAYDMRISDWSADVCSSDLQRSPRRRRGGDGRQAGPPRRRPDGAAGLVTLVGVDVGSTTVKAVAVEDGRVTWQDYQRHNTKQAATVVESDRQSVVYGKMWSGRVDLGGCRDLKKKNSK